MPGLVVAAVAAELGPIPGAALGVGPLRAGVAMARLLQVHRPSHVVLVGSCGVYGDRWPLGTAVVGTTLGWAESGAVAGLGYVPLPPEPLSAAPLPVLPASTAVARRTPTARILTVGAITADRTLATAHGAGWDVEHMEAYGAALACADAGVPLSVVLGIANRVGPAAHAEWTAHRGAAEAAARDVLVRHGWVAGQILPVEPQGAG